MPEQPNDPGDHWPWGSDFDTLKGLKLKAASGARAPNAAAVFVNDAPGYVVKRLTYLYVYLDRPSITHDKEVLVATGQYTNDQAGVFARCVGIVCIAYATLPNGTSRLLSGRTEYFHDAGGWEVNAFAVSDMREGPG